MSKKDFSVALKYVEARPRSQRHKGAEARVSGISVGGSGVSATDLSLLNANLISVTNNFTALKDLFDSMFEKDSDGNIHAKLSLWSSGGITAGGVGSGGTGGGGASYDRLDAWADYSAEKAGYVLSALLGNDLNNRLTSVENAGYVTASTLAPYALRSEIPSLVGYATESFVTSQGYITASALGGYATQSWVESKNYLTGITSAMVTTVLGYTPYNSANFTKDNLKSTLGISDWALASVKPTYTASEVGALSVYGGTVNSPSLASLVINRNNSTGASVITFTRNSDFTYFLGFNDNSGPKWLNADYQEYPLLHSGNYSSYALPLTGGVMAKNSYIDWGNTDGFEDYVAYSDGFKILGYNAGSGDYRGGIHVGVRYGWQLTREAGSEVFQIRNYSPSSASWGNWKTLAFTDSNVASATKLATARTIWGQSFDGTGNISGNLSSDAWRIITDYSTQGVFVQAKLADGTSDAGRVFITGLNGANLSLFNVWSVTTRIKGNVGINIDYPSEALHVNGNGKFTGAITANSLTIGGVTLTYDSANEALCINGNMYALGGITAGGVGSGGSGGGGASYDRLDSWADYSADKSGWVLSALLGNDLNNRLTSVENAGYVTASTLAPYALRSEIPSLVGYATESFVTSQGYITASALGGYATQSWVESKNYLTGITSAMVTTVLGYTPYNSANFTKANIKSTLGISDWALASAKPTYTASEVGALGVNGTAQSALKMTPEYLTDLNSATPWRFFDMNTGYGSADGNKPNIAWVSGITGTAAGSSNYRWQLAATTGNARPYFRRENNGNWSNWGTLAFTSDIPTKLSQLTDDVVAGNYLSKNGGTVNGSITASSFIGNLVGVADKSKVLGDYYGERITSANLDFTDSAVRKIIATSSMTTAHPPADGSILHFAWDNTGGWNHQLFIACGENPDPDKRMAWRAQYYGSWGEWKPIAFTDSNVASATKLATARNIFGHGFNGTQNILGGEKSIEINSVNAISDDPNNWIENYSLKLESANNAMTFMVDKTENGRKAMIQVGHNHPSYANFLGALYLNPLGGNVAIGGKTADEKFHVHGNGKFTGSVTASSLTIGGATITYDSVNEALCINGNMYALGGITAGGAGISAYTSLESRVTRIEQQLNIS